MKTILRLGVLCILVGLSAACAPRVVRAPASSGSQVLPDEAAVLAELNSARRNPAAYARHLRELLDYFDGNILRQPGRVAVQTSEGRAAVVEAIGALKRTSSVPPLKNSAALAAAARDHARDQGATGAIGHRGKFGSKIDQRIERHGRWTGGISENIHYGSSNARDVVISLIVDDGVPDRGHRDTIFTRELRFAGVACGPHRTFRTMCVIDYAVGMKGLRKR